MISFTYEFKLKPSKRQIKDIEMYLDICRSVYNWNHRERKDWIESRKSLVDRCSITKEYIISPEQPFPNYYIQANNLTKAKEKYSQIKQVHSQVLQSTLKRLDQAWNDFFKVEVSGVTLDRDVAAAKVIENRGRVAVGQPVLSKNTCGDRGAGIEQLMLFDLVTGQ